MYKVYVEIYNGEEFFTDDYFDDPHVALAWAIEYVTELIPTLYEIHGCTWRITNDQVYMESKLSQ